MFDLATDDFLGFYRSTCSLVKDIMSSNGLFRNEFKTRGQSGLNPLECLRHDISCEW